MWSSFKLNKKTLLYIQSTLCWMCGKRNNSSFIATTLHLQRETICLSWASIQHKRILRHMLPLWQIKYQFPLISASQHQLSSCNNSSIPSQTITERNASKRRKFCIFQTEQPLSIAFADIGLKSKINFIYTNPQ